MKMVKSLILGSAAGLDRHEWSTGSRSSRQGQSGRVREDLLPVRCRFLLHPGHRHLHQAGWLSARRNRVQRQRRLRHAGLERRCRSGQPPAATTSPPVPVRTSTSIRAPRPNTAWSAPTSMRRSTGPLGARRDRRRNGGIAAASACTIAFIQFAGFTIGKAVSQFDAPWINYPGNNFDPARRPRRRHRCQPDHLHRSVRQRRVGHDFGSRIRPPITRLALCNTSTGRQPRPAWSAASTAPAPTAASRSPDIVGQDPRRPGLGSVPGVGGGSPTSTPATTTFRRCETTGHPERQVGLGGSGRPVDQEHPDRSGRQHQLQAVYTNGATRYVTRRR